MNDDNILNINDAIEAMKLIIENKTSELEKKVGDVDNNKRVDLIDVINIGKAIEGKDIVREKLNKEEVTTSATHETIKLNTNLAPSVYEQWLEIEKRNRPGLTDSEDTFESFIKKLTGPKGNKGDTGDSVYKEWKKISGNEEKTTKDFLDYVKGPKGADGNPGKDALPVINKNKIRNLGEKIINMTEEQAFENLIDSNSWKKSDIFKFNEYPNYYTDFKLTSEATSSASRINTENWEILKTYKPSNVETIVSHNEKLYKFIGENNSTAHNPDDENYRSIWIPYESTRSTKKLSTANFTSLGKDVVIVEDGKDADNALIATTLAGIKSFREAVAGESALQSSIANQLKTDSAFQYILKEKTKFYYSEWNNNIFLTQTSGWAGHSIATLKTTETNLNWANDEWIFVPFIGGAPSNWSISNFNSDPQMELTFYQNKTGTTINSFDGLKYDSVNTTTPGTSVTITNANTLLGNTTPITGIITSTYQYFLSFDAKTRNLPYIYLLI